MNTVQQYIIDKCAIVIIAAGESKRLGSPKQLLVIEDDTMLNRLVKTVNKALDLPIFLVLGANTALIKPQLPNIKLNIIENKYWQEGMGSSIRKGIQAVVDSAENFNGVLILVCDQPYITKASLQSLIQLQEEKCTPIAASFYANVAGTPALFHKSVFPELLALKGDQGARRIILAREQELAKLHFEKGVLDIDTPEDYKQLLKEVRNKC